MLSKFFNRKQAPAAPVQPAAPVVHDPYEYMSNEQARTAMLTAVLDDDLGVVKSIARHHPGCVDWMIVAKGSAIGNEPMTTPLINYAAGNGSLRVLQWMIDNNVNLEARSNVLNQTALFHACQRGQRVVVDMLLQAGADPHTRAEVPSPITAVSIARQNDHHDIADLLEREQQRADSKESLSLRDERTISAPKVTFKKS